MRSRLLAALSRGNGIAGRKRSSQLRRVVAHGHQRNYGIGNHDRSD